MIGQLIDEAERAMIDALAHLCQQLRIERQPQRLPFVLLERIFDLLAVSLGDQIDVLLAAKGLIVDPVDDFFPVDGHKAVAGADPQLIGDAARLNGDDLMRHGASFPFD